MIIPTEKQFQTKQDVTGGIQNLYTCWISDGHTSEHSSENIFNLIKNQ